MNAFAQLKRCADGQRGASLVMRPCDCGGIVMLKPAAAEWWDSLKKNPSCTACILATVRATQETPR